MSYQYNYTDLRSFTDNQGSSKKFSLREMLIKYLSFLPLFVFALAVSLGSALLYIRYKVPIYKANIQIMVGNGSSQVAGNQSQQDLINQAVTGVRPINLDNEMQLIKSKKLLQRVVEKGQFNITYNKEGNIKTFDAYNIAPFVLKVISVKDSTNQIVLKMNRFYPDKIEVEEQPNKFIYYKWNDTVQNAQMRFVLEKKEQTYSGVLDPYIAIWKSPAMAAAEAQGRISVNAPNAKTSVIELTMVGENRKKCEDFLNLMVKEIIISDVEQKKEAALNTINFIENRLQLVSKELGEIEDKLTGKDKQNIFPDLQSEYTYYISRLNEGERGIESLKSDLNILNLIEEYIRNNKGNVKKSKLIPSGLLINDVSLNNMIASYNLLQQKKETLEPNLTKESSLYKELEQQAADLRVSILESVITVRKALQLKLETITGRRAKDLIDVAKIPDEKREKTEIERNKQIKEKLFIYLLQKKEETAIATVSTLSNYTSLDFAKSSGLPIEPKSQQIKTFAFLIGIVLPILIIYLLDLMNDKVTVRQDITDRTDIPLVGEISHVDSGEAIVVQNSRNVVAEQFRILRSNLQFILPKDAPNTTEAKAKTILVTSSISGEGKSFISLNLACVLALSEKKVALLEFDLRKLKGINIPELDNISSKGITNYLIGQYSHPSEISQQISKFPTLSIFRTGPIPPNPAELIISNRMNNFFDYLKANYDYIIVDSAPVGLVSDSFSLNDYADNVIYVVRQRYTFKKQLDFINEVKNANKLKNLTLVVNDVNLTGRYGYYGYGYGYGYGYMYRYGFGYGYNRYIYGGKKNDPYFNVNKKGYFDDTSKKSWWQKLLNR